jgi:DnaJ family protein B protein 12
MESNKDEALRALAIAQRKRDAGDVAAARKFATKSLALFATPEAERLLASLDKMPESSSASTASFSAASGSEAHSSASGARHRTKEPPPQEKKREYTQENITVVKRVRACKATQYYEILDLKRECEEGEVKKAYRRVRRLLAALRLAIETCTARAGVTS